MSRMILKDVSEVPSEIPRMDGVKDATMRLLFGKPDSMPHFYMREFLVEPGGHTPLHSHDYEHEVYILGGTGEVECGGVVKPVAEGKAIYIPANEPHQFRNNSSEALRFLCLVPAQP